MANPLDDFINARVKKPFSMTDYEAIPVENRQEYVKNTTANMPAVSKEPTMNIEGDLKVKTPVSTPRVEEIKKIFAPAAPEMAPIPPTTPVPETPAKVPPVEEKGFDWASLLPALAPLATEALMSGGGTAGESLGISGSHLLTQEGKKETRKNELENKLLDMQKARELASIKASGKEKPLTTSNTLPVVGEDGKIRYEMVGEAIGKEKPMDAPKGLTSEEWNRRQNYTYRLKSGLEKDKLSSKEKKDNRDLEVKLSKEWSSDEFTKGTRKVADAYKRIEKIDPANTNRIEEMGAIFDLMKSLDPQSVVRESEQAMAINARSYSDVVNYFDSILSGESKLTKTQLQNIKKFATNLYRKRMESQSDLDKGYTERAKRYSLNSENIVQNISSAPMPPELPPEGTVVRQGNQTFTMGKNGEWK
jgi:hypothetical protein